uniref:Uncharacterized protein n=1 Tax=uncultured Caudovirales phage TaxID=2100421 RepID=A0A6J5KVC8_9CAUD|nr:hypothetical protein UFOVP88_25 [uncultured Caudovirales phage]
MSYQPFFITQYDDQSGLNTYYQQFLIPDKAFPILEDAYCWRGQVKRRRGYSSLGRLQRQVSVSGTLSLGAFNLITGLSLESSANIVPGSINIVGGTDGTTYTDPNKNGTLTATGGTGTGGTINYVTGALTITAGSNQSISGRISYYPGLPVMGLEKKETTADSIASLITFDQHYAYRILGSPGTFSELPSSTPVVWHGSDLNFFWSTNYYFQNTALLFWVTNFNNSLTPDPMYYYNGTTWTAFHPLITGSTTVWTCLAMVPYKGRLLLFNTWEGITANGQGAAVPFVNRMRWNGPSGTDPTLQSTNWRDDVVGFGGHADAPTQEQITGVEFIKDVLIVKTERASWKIVYTGNPALPFLWEKVNTELGCESPFSLIPFDSGVLAVANVGITTDSSVNVERIDINIPNTVFAIDNNNNDGYRVQGIRDYVNELVFWSYVDDSDQTTYPDKTLVYNYRNNTWAIFNDSFTCFGYYQNPSPYTWATLPYLSWNDWNDSWNSGVEQAFYPQIVGGNQQGFVMLQGTGVQNGSSLALYGITTSSGNLTIPNHNLKSGQFITFSGCLGTVSYLNGNTYQVNTIVDLNTITLNQYNAGVITPLIFASNDTYLGNGLIAIIQNFDIWTKRFSPAYDQGKQVRLGYVDVLAFRTPSGQITANYYINENDVLALNNASYDQIPATIDSVVNNSTLLTCPENLTLMPFQSQQDKIWHRFPVYCLAQNFQIEFTMSPQQMFGYNSDGTSNPGLPVQDFIMYAMTLYMTPTARLAP